jgi:phosphoribosylformylglycinamidine synthase
MILFFKPSPKRLIALESNTSLGPKDIEKLSWLFGGAKLIPEKTIDGYFIGPRREMISPWSTNAVEITRNMGIANILRIEEFFKAEKSSSNFDPMLQALYHKPGQNLFQLDRLPAEMQYVDDIESYNNTHGLALSPDEVSYLETISQRIGRQLTDSEVYGFAQVNSEHCRHKIFNGTFIIDGKTMPDTLFALIKKTAKVNPNRLVSAYKDNVAFVLGPRVEQFAPTTAHQADFFAIKDIDTVIAIKAETHNFPTTVEPFNGASTGSGGEIRDRLAGGKGSVPLAGTAVYMTAYARTEENRSWEQNCASRPWLYQKPDDILIKASNGASDFGNKFGQPLINGSLLTFEHEENQAFGYDKVIMMAGGVGYARKEDSLKETPEPGDLVIVLGGDNYRIGMGGGAVSSVDTGQFANAIELNAVQRANPEMQKRVANVIRAMTETDNNPVRSIHDHGAGGHLNSLSELVEKTGGIIHIDKLPVGDPTLSDMEIIGNESQERMGLIIRMKDLLLLKQMAERERAPLYEVGLITDDDKLVFKRSDADCPIDLKLDDLFGKAPKTVLEDQYKPYQFKEIRYSADNIYFYLNQVLQLEAVACKDWLTNKVDRSVTGRVALQQCAGPIQLPLNNLGVVALDYKGIKGIATAIGHAPVPSLIDSRIGSRLAVAEALTNIVWAPIQDGLSGISLSANWMWPAKNEGENSRLYMAVKALSDFCIELGINVPTGKDSLSMTQKYPDGRKILSPGTVIVSAVGEVSNVRKVVQPVLKNDPDSCLIYIDFSGSQFHLGGSSLGQALNAIGKEAPDIMDSGYFVKTFNAVQQLIELDLLLSGHDVSAGGLITCLLEMTFSNPELGLHIELDGLKNQDTVSLLFSEKPAVVVQVSNNQQALKVLDNAGIQYINFGSVSPKRLLMINHLQEQYIFDIDTMLDVWFRSSYLLDRNQSGEKHALERFRNFKKHDLEFSFGKQFTGKFQQYGIDPHRRKPTGTKAAIIREKGVNGDREMAYALYLAGFDVKDIHMTDLISGHEDLSDVQMIVFVGGFSNSDVLGSAKGWAGAFLYNEKAKKALDDFYAREDTLSLGVCNGCQLMMELNLVYPHHEEQPRMLHNDSGKFESAFLAVDIPSNNSIMLESMGGKRLGVWVAHGEGKFSFPCFRDNYNIVMTYGHETYPANPNGSDWDTAAICSNDGRHLAMMPHIERAFVPWQWAYYPEAHLEDDVSPWIEAFVNARGWIENNNKGNQS